MIYEDIKHLILCSRIPYFSAGRLVAASKQISYELEILTNSGKNVLSTCVTILCSWVLRTTRDTQLMHEWVYFGEGALVIFI